MDGVSGGLARAPTQPQPRSLDRVEAAASRLENLNDSLQRFIDRYHGNPQQSGETARGVPCSIIGHVAKLEDELMRLDNITNSICEIG